MSVNLTPEGQRLADALVKAEIIFENFGDYEPFTNTLEASELNTAAALLLTAPEGERAGLREALAPEIANFEEAYSKAVATSHADHWMTAALYGQQLRNAIVSPLTKPPAAQEPAAAGVDEGSTRWGPSFPPSSCNAYEDCCHDGVCHDPDQCEIKGPNEPDEDEADTLTPSAPKTPDAATGGSVGDGGLREAALSPNWLAEEFASAEAEIAQWPPGLRASFDVALAQPAPVGEDETSATDGPLFVHDFAAPAVSSNPSPCDVTLSCDHPATLTVAFMGNGITGTLEEARANARKLARLWNAGRIAPVGEDETGVRDREIEEIAEHLHEERDYSQWTWPTHEDDDGYRGNGRVTITPPDIQAHLRDEARRILIRVDQLRRGAPQPPKAETPAGVGDDAAVEAALQAQTRYDHNLDWAQFANRIGADPQRKRMRAILSAALSATPSTRPGDEVGEELTWLRTQVILLCEHTEDKSHSELQKPDLTEHERGFYKGAYTEAKGIRRAIADIVRTRLAALSTAPAARPGDEVERVRHVKRGTEYEVLHRSVELQVAVARGEPQELLETTITPEAVCWEGDRLVVYQGKDGKLWARVEAEFDDGRFVPAAAPAADGGRA